MMAARIVTRDLQIYRRLYQANWPKYIVTYGLLDHFIDRFQKLPEWEGKIQFLKPENSDINDGTFVFINGPHIYFDTLKPSPFDELNSLMHQLDYSQEKVFVGVRDVFRPFLHDLIRVQYLEKTFDTGTRCIFIDYKIDYETIKSLEHEYRSQIPKGYYQDSLKEEDAAVLNSIWAQRHVESIEFLKTAIRMNPSTGIYKDDGELIAWNIFLETGAMGNLQVKEEFKRKQFASLVTQIQFMKVMKMGRSAFGHIVHQNDASFNFSTKKHLGKWIGNNSWIGVKKKAKSDLAPLWGHL